MLDEIEAMRNELLQHIDTWSKSNSEDKWERLDKFRFASDELAELAYWLKHNERYRPR